MAKKPKASEPVETKGFVSHDAPIVVKEGANWAAITEFLSGAVVETVTRNAVMTNAPGLEHVVLSNAETLLASANRKVDELQAYITFLHKNYPNKLVSYEQWRKKAGK